MSHALDPTYALWQDPSLPFVLQDCVSKLEGVLLGCVRLGGPFSPFTTEVGKALSVEDQIVNMFRGATHYSHSAQLWWREGSRHHIMNRHGYVPRKLCLQRQAALLVSALLALPILTAGWEADTMMSLCQTQGDPALIDRDHRLARKSMEMLHFLLSMSPCAVALISG